jgi:hypothetical protein
MGDIDNAIEAVKSHQWFHDKFAWQKLLMVQNGRE